MCRRIISFVTAGIISLCCVLNCTAVEFDGVPHNSEWMDSTVWSFENPDGFNNGVNFAYIRIIPNESANQLFLCISMRVDELTDAGNSAVLLSLNSEDEIYLKGDGDSPYNTDLYNIEYAMSYDEGASNIVYEVMLGVKYGIPADSTLTVRLCDCESIPSNAFGFELSVASDDSENTQASETAQKSTKKTASTKKNQKSTSKKSNSAEGGSDDAFTFKKVEIDENTQAGAANYDETTTSTVNLTQKAVDNNSVKKKILVAVGVVCALAVATCAVYSGMKKSAHKKEDKE